MHYTHSTTHNQYERYCHATAITGRITVCPSVRLSVRLSRMVDKAVDEPRPACTVPGAAVTSGPIAAKTSQWSALGWCNAMHGRPRNMSALRRHILLRGAHDPALHVSSRLNSALLSTSGVTLLSTAPHVLTCGAGSWPNLF